MGLLDSLFGSVQDIAQGAIPDPQELINGALGETTIDETIQGVVEAPQETIQNSITDIISQ